MQVGKGKEQQFLWSGWLSKSQVRRFEKCPYSWYLERVKKVCPEERPELSKGRTIHEILAWVYTQRDKYSSIEEIAEQLTLHPDSKKFSDQIDNFLTALRYWTITHPLYTEFTVKDVDYAVIGVIDRIDMIDGQMYVVEYKWNYKDYNTDDYIFELSLYAKLFEKQNRAVVNNGGVIFLNDGFVKTFKLTDETKNSAIEHILDVRGAIFRSLAHNSFKKNRGRWCDYCQFKKYCALYDKTRQNPLSKNE